MIIIYNYLFIITLRLTTILVIFLIKALSNMKVASTLDNSVSRLSCGMDFLRKRGRTQCVG